MLRSVLRFGEVVCSVNRLSIEFPLAYLSLYRDSVTRDFPWFITFSLAASPSDGFYVPDPCDFFSYIYSSTLDSLSIGTFLKVKDQLLMNYYYEL